MFITLRWCIQLLESSTEEYALVRVCNYCRWTISPATRLTGKSVLVPLFPSHWGSRSDFCSAHVSRQDVN